MYLKFFYYCVTVLYRVEYRNCLDTEFCDPPPLAYKVILLFQLSVFHLEFIFGSLKIGC